MLQIKNLSIVHKKDLRILLKEFHFVINAGDKAVIIGEEGNGKSTLLKWIYDPELVEGYVEAAGERICRGERLGYLPQELPASEKEKTVYEYFSETPFFWEQEPREIKRLMNQLGLPSDFVYEQQRLATLSGGEKVKVQMARLFMEKPSILLLDEPSNDIDIPTLEWLEKMIQKAEIPVLFISHDETLIENTANVIIHLEQLRRKTTSRYTVARMPYGEYVRQRQAGMENQKAKALNDRRQEKIRQEKFRKIQEKVERDQANITRQEPFTGALLKKKMKAVKALEHRYAREAEKMTEMPETEESIFIKFGEKINIPQKKVILDVNLDCLQVDNRVLARNVRLQVKGPEKICIIGKNGVGKTTLLRQIAGQMLEREDIHAAYMSQNYEEQMDMDRTPVEYLSVSGDKEEITRIRNFLGSMKYTAEEAGRPIRELSGGQKAKVFLLKMSLSGANVLLLDEPTRNFSPLSNPVIRQVLAAYEGAVISISHDRKYIHEVCGRVYELTQEGLAEKWMD